MGPEHDGSITSDFSMIYSHCEQDVKTSHIHKLTQLQGSN